jgi:hypothetical protein
MRNHPHADKLVLLGVVGALCIAALVVHLARSGGVSDKSNASTPATNVAPPSTQTVDAIAVLRRDWEPVVLLENQNDHACNMFPNQSIPPTPTGTFASCQNTLRKENAAMRRVVRDLRIPDPRTPDGATLNAFRVSVQNYLAETSQTYRDLVRRDIPAVHADEFFPWGSICIAPVNHLLPPSAQQLAEMPYQYC